MPRRMSKGTCQLCQATFSKAAMTRHLLSCIKRHAGSKTPPGKGRLQKTRLFHLVVEGRYRPEYWMHLEVPAHAMLEDLDRFLRHTWLECCGHLSAFTIHGETYTTSPIGPLEEVEGEDMGVALGEVLGPGVKFTYEYDFGTTTELSLKVVSEGEGEVRGKAPRILARNEAPLRTCESCGKIATRVCNSYSWVGEGWVCEGCAGTHECGEERLLPVVNSPRVGMCGYTG